MRPDRFRLIPFPPAAALAAALLLPLSGCGEKPGNPAAAGQDASPRKVESGAELQEASTDQLSPERKAELDAEHEEKRKRSDESCRKLLDSFQARIYDSIRDSALDHLSGRVDVRVIRADGSTSSGTYDVAFNAENDLTQQTVTVAAEGADELPDDTGTVVQRLAATGFRSGYYFVITYLPSVQLTLMKTKTGQWGVHCPPIQLTGATYVFDDKNRVVTRGVNHGNRTTIDHFEWESSQNREILKRARSEGGTFETEWTWSDAHSGVYLPELITFRRAEETFELRFDYDTVETASQ